ncbi:UbiA prenyltransferase [Streptomyces davaonensis JCM 4913]|uniref:UbiA prenyltransferase n=1 Tax=Streptomyces davaonensis (strain DSM 101723 / JCM 4913 / KCC S-0913 / 768) TaxID=1214101 RepID=K4QTS6_STRDJ|nr:UbiA family prenyltransferase [Streptomyces davaonensis]CCK26916.1 UbiA prenyltransferase [Streptomyces davaonensis JCM 4913]
MNAARDWAQLLRVSALFTVPGDALAGAAAAGVRADRRTALAIGCSLCLYEAGMVLNDWADQDEDARERPDRPLPSGRIHPAAALGAAAGLTTVGLAFAARAGRPAAAVAGVLAATVWAYDLKLKHTSAGAVAMGAARGLDLLLGAVATGGRPLRPAVTLSSAALAAHTYAVTRVARNETTGGAGLASLAALATSAVIGTALAWRSVDLAPSGTRPVRDLAAPTFAALYGATAARPYLHAALNPSPDLTQRAVGGGIRSLIPLQAALAAHAGAPACGAALMALAPLARRISRKVSPT